MDFKCLRLINRNQLEIGKICCEFVVWKKKKTNTFWMMFFASGGMHSILCYAMLYIRLVSIGKRGLWFMHKVNCNLFYLILSLRCSTATFQFYFHFLIFISSGNVFNKPFWQHWLQKLNNNPNMRRVQYANVHIFGKFTSKINFPAKTQFWKWGFLISTRPIQ